MFSRPNIGHLGVTMLFVAHILFGNGRRKRRLSHRFHRAHFSERRNKKEVISCQRSWFPFFPLLFSWFFGGGILWRLFTISVNTKLFSLLSLSLPIFPSLLSTAKS
jgi:hypothetical protein